MSNEDKKVPIEVVIGALLIISLPFLALLATRFIPLADRIESGPPVQQMVVELKSILHDRLNNDEKIIWVAQPEPGRETMAKWYFIPFGIAFTLFAFFWVYAALDFKISNLKDWKRIGWVLFGLPFTIGGLLLCLLPFITYWQDAKTIYVITDARIFGVVDKKPRIMTAFNWRAFGPIETKEYSPEKMDILFARSYSDDKHSSIGFYGIDKGERLKFILEKFLAEKPSKTLDPHEHFTTRPPETD